MKSRGHVNRLLFLAMFWLMISLAGCGGLSIPSLTGGGLPPGEPDIGGLVLQATTDATGLADTAQAGEAPVPGAEVKLLIGMREVGKTLSGPDGYFRFEAPPTGNYRAEVTPPAGSGLQRAEREFRHQVGRQTFLRIVLER